MAKLSAKPQSLPPLMQLEPFSGIDLSATPTQLDDHHSPDMLNMNIDERGALNKRTGFARVIPYLASSSINGMSIYETTDGVQQFIYASNENLIKLTLGDQQLATWAIDDLSLTWEGEL